MLSSCLRFWRLVTRWNLLWRSDGRCIEPWNMLEKNTEEVRFWSFCHTKHKHKVVFAVFGGILGDFKSSDSISKVQGTVGCFKIWIVPLPSCHHQDCYICHVIKYFEKPPPKVGQQPLANTNLITWVAITEFRPASCRLISLKISTWRMGSHLASRYKPWKKPWLRGPSLLRGRKLTMVINWLVVSTHLKNIETTT